ncbi:hypothetical protein ODU70_26020, partial [Escherichia coli]|nr:hypothetical protein [Escherichia coli]
IASGSGWDGLKTLVAMATRLTATMADDPDEENTLATAVFTLDANHVRWQIFDINRDDAKFHGEVRG